MMTAPNGRRPGGLAARKAPAKVNSNTRVNVALPFSQFKIEEPSEQLVALASLVEDLADLVVGAAPGPKAEALQLRAHELASKLR